MKKQRGVTLMELLTVVTIVGILSAIAYPSFTDQARRGRRAAAKSMLSEVLQQQERFYSTNNTYTLNMSDLGYGGGPYRTENNTHTIALAVGPSGDIRTSVTISATPVAADVKCNVLSLSSNMARAATGTQPAICW